MDGQPKACTKATNKAKRSLRSQTDPEEEKTMDMDEEEDEEEGARLKTQSAATTDQDAELLRLKEASWMNSRDERSYRRRYDQPEDQMSHQNQDSPCGC